MSTPQSKPVKIDANDVAASLGTAGLRAKVEELVAKAPVVGGVAATCRSIADWLADPETLCPPPRISTTYNAVDDALGGGLVPGGMYLLVGLTGRGKSTMALNLARRMATSNVRTLLVSLEDAPQSAVRRLLAQESKQPLKSVEDYGKSGLDSRHITAIDEAMLKLRAIPLEIEGETSDLPGIETLIRMKANEGTRVFIIDQSSWIGIPGSDSSYEEATEIARRLKLLARAIKAVVIVLVQVNRAGAGAKAAGQDIELHHIRESGRWEQDCDGALILQTVDDSVDPALLVIDLKKHRHGPKDRSCRLHFVMPQNLIDDDPNQPQAIKSASAESSDKGPPAGKWTLDRFAQEVIPCQWTNKAAIQCLSVESGLSAYEAGMFLMAAESLKKCEVRGGSGRVQKEYRRAGQGAGQEPETGQSDGDSGAGQGGTGQPVACKKNPPIPPCKSGTRQSRLQGFEHMSDFDTRDKVVPEASKKQRIVEMITAEPRLSASEIAGRCGVDASYVRRVRRGMDQAGK